jgi:hypothetical protein
MAQLDQVIFYALLISKFGLMCIQIVRYKTPLFDGAVAFNGLLYMFQKIFFITGFSYRWAYYFAFSHVPISNQTQCTMTGVFIFYVSVF